MNAFSRESRSSSCGKRPSLAVPYLGQAPAVTPPKTSIVSRLPHLAGWGTAKHGTGSCRTAAPAAPPLGGSRWGGAVNDSREILHPQCRLNQFDDGGRAAGHALGRGKSARENLSLGAVSP
jgi:hypothetical protein